MKNITIRPYQDADRAAVGQSRDPVDCYQVISSPIGPITIRSNGAALTGLWFAEPSGTVSGAMRREDFILRMTADWLDGYFAGKAPRSRSIPLSPSGTVFQKLVWEELLKIPYGRTATYGRIAAAVAARMGKPRMSAQAVGGAVGSNPISILIPCHRVLGADRRLTGYAGGLERKMALLDLEGIPYKT